METNYETIVDTQNLIWTMGVYLLHGGMVFVQTSLAIFLLSTGAHNLLMPNLDRTWLRRLGSSEIGRPNTRVIGAIRIALGGLLFAPIAMGAPASVSLVAAIGALVVLIGLERKMPSIEKGRGRLLRRAAIGFSAIASIFITWEGEDNLVLGADLLGHSMEWRNEELAWQISRDAKSPKVGDLAPDFELQDTEGNVSIRLSDFRGKRSVALVFGSYT